MGVRRIFRVRCAVALTAGLYLLPGAASAVQNQVRILMDLDDDAATGCSVVTPAGTFTGVEQVLITTVETTNPPPAGTVTDVATSECTDPGTNTFGAPASFDGGWPVGIDNGVGGLDVVETYLPLVASAVPDPKVIRVGVLVTDERGGAHALLTVDGTRTGGPILLDLRSPLEIPTLGEWGLILLALLLAAASVRLLGRRGSAALGVALLLAAGGVAWAACLLDGQTDDWSAGDEVASSAGTVLFAQHDATRICFRVDTALLFNSPPVADAQAVSTDEDTPVAITLTGSDPEMGALTFSIVSGPAHGGLTGAPPNVTYTPDPNYNGPDAFDFQVQDPGGLTGTATVSITVNPVNDPPVVSPASFSVPENSAPGTNVGTPVAFADPDIGQTHTFAITAGNTGGAFSIDSSTGQIQVAGALDFETLAAYSLTVQVTDDGTPVLSGTATVDVTVTNVDDPPVAVADSATVTEDDPATAIDVLANDTDQDGGPKAIQSVTQPANGTVVITNSGADLTYQPDADYCNAPPPDTFDTFTYTLTPGGSTANVTVTVTCVDDPPVAVADSATVTEDSGANAVDVLANDTDVDGGTKLVASVTQPANGTVAITGGGTGVTYAPNADYCNTPPGTTLDTFTYTLTPGSSTATVTMTVTCVDDPPVAVADSATVAEDSGANTVDVLANDTDIDSGPKAVQSVTQPANGTVAITGGGSAVSYTPNANYCNTPPGTTLDTFTYTLAPGGSSTTVTMTVTCVDDPPLAVADSATVSEDSGANAIDVLLNDIDIDAGPKMVTLVQNPSNHGGTVLITGGGSGVSYAPAADYCNTPPGTTLDTFTYTLNGGSSATVTVIVTCVNDPPVIDLDGDDDKGTTGSDFAVTFTEGDGATLLEDPTPDATGAVITDVDSTTLVSLTVTLTNLLDPGDEVLDADVSGFPNITKDYDTTTTPGVGVLTLSSLTPQPLADWVAVLRTVSYRDTSSAPDATARVVHFVANDGAADSNTATSTVTVVPVDNPPVAVADSATVTEDSGANTIDVLANDTDVDGGTKQVQSVTQPASGAVVITNGGADLTYAPNANYCNDGTPVDTFTYTLNGGSTATVSVTVTCVDDPPVAVADSVTVVEDSGANAIDVLANDTDVDGGPKSIQSVTQPANGAVVITGGGTGLTYAPAANYCNDPPGTTPDTFTYTLTPGGSTATVSVKVTCVDDPPVAVADAATVIEDSGANAIDVLANDTDVDGGPKSIQSVTQPANGAVVITGGGTGLTYAPAANYCNDPPGTTPDTFTYTLTPGGSTATVSVKVTCVDDPPVAVADAATVIEDSGANAIDVLANDTDIDGGPKSIQSVTQPANGAVVITGGGTGLTYAPAANYCNDPPGTTPDTFTYTLTPGGSTATVSVKVTCVNDPPVAGADSFDFIGNTELEVDQDTASTPEVLATTGSTFGVLDNDSDPVEGDAIAVTSITVGVCTDSSAPFDCTDAAVGTVHMAANGRFDFVPAPGDTDATETFTYVVTDNGVPAPASTTGTVTLHRFERVWYVDPAAGSGGTGTSDSPFDSLGSLSGAGGAGDSDAAGDYIFVYAGSLALSAPVEMEANQHLLGAGVGLSIPVALNGNASPTALVAASTKPQLTNSTGNAVTVTTAIPVEIRGLSLASTTANPIDLTTAAALSGSSTLTIDNNQIRGAGAEGIDVNLNPGTSGTLTLAVTNTTWNTAGTLSGNAIDVNRQAGTLRIDLSNLTSVLSTGASGIVVADTSLGATTITGFSGNSVHQNTAGTGISITNVTFDATPGGSYQQVSGGTTAVGISGNGVGANGVVLANVAGDLAFTDLDVFADGGAGLRVSGTGAVNVGAGTGTRVTVGAGVGIVEATGGPAVDLSGLTADLQLTTLKSTGSPTTGVSLVNVADGTSAAVVSAGSGSSISSATGTAFNVSGGNANVSYAGTISNSAGNSVVVQNRTADTVALSGAVNDTGSGISLTSNTGSTINFTGALTLSTGASTAFSATGGGTVTATDTASTLATTTATALNVANTTIGAGGLKFASVSAGTGASGPANGIVLNATGSSGSLTVNGGTIQHTSSHGVSLTSTLGPSFNAVTIQNAGGSGVKGTGVTGFSFTNGTINTTGAGADESSIAFNTAVTGTENNVSGTVTISGNMLLSSGWHGVDIENFSGTLDNLTISSNTITSSTSTATSKGSGIRIQPIGSATTAASLTKATISGNVISNFPSGAGILAQGGNSSSSGPSGTIGVSGSATDVVSITGNTIHGQSSANLMGTSAIIATVSGKGQGNFSITGNGSVANPLTNMAGTAILCGTNGDTTSTFDVSNNVIVANNTVASNGIGGGTGVTFGTSDTPNMTWTINNNNVSATDGNGILAVARGATGTLRVKIQNNTVAAPLSGVRQGIRVDAGNGASIDDAVCLNISGNTSAGSGGTQGIGLRKQGTTSTTNDFGVNGMAATSSPGVEAYVDGLNPAGNGTLLISATSGFSNCSFP